jgi:hypothetical protein
METEAMCRPAIWYTRVAGSALSLALVGLVVVLWARSHSVEDRASGHARGVGVRFYSSRGWLVCSRNSGPGAASKYPWELALQSDYWLSPGDSRLQFQSPTRLFHKSDFTSASAPHWLIGGLTAGIAILLKPQVRWRISLAELLIAMTVWAICLAGIGALTRLVA